MFLTEYLYAIDRVRGRTKDRECYEDTIRQLKLKLRDTQSAETSCEYLCKQIFINGNGGLTVDATLGLCSVVKVKDPSHAVGVWR